MKRFITLVFGVILAVNFATAQSNQLKTYSGTKEVSVNRKGADRFDCKEVYQYYVGEDGSYIKSGSYSLSGTKTTNSDGPGSGNVTESYSVSATFKDGYLDGKLTAKMSVKGYMSYTLFTKWDCNVEVTLSCNFKDGKPDGQWIYTERGDANGTDGDDKNIYKTTFNCENGYFVGDFDVNFARNYLFPVTKQKGHFDQNGNLISLTMRGGKSLSLDKDLGVKEYTFSPDRQLLSYIHRDKNNQSKGYYKLDEELIKQNPSDTLEWIAAMKNNGYIVCNVGKSVRTNLQYECNYTNYANKDHSGPYGTDCYGTYFSTYDIVNYIYSSLMLKENVGGIKESKGLFNRYNIIIVDKLEKFPVKQLSESQLQQLIQNPTEKFRNDYMEFFKINLEEHNIIDHKGVYFLKERDTMFYLNKEQEEQYKNETKRYWNTTIEKNNTSMVLEAAEKDLVNGNWMKKGPEGKKPTSTIAYNIDSLWISADSLYHCKCRIDYRMNYYKMKEQKNQEGITIWETAQTAEWKTAQTEIIYKVIYQKRGYWGVVGDAERQDNSFNHWEHIDNIWDTIKTLDSEIQQVSQEQKDIFKSYQKLYNITNDKFNQEMNDKTILGSHARSFILLQHEYLSFIQSINEINANNETIKNTAKDEIDVYTSYQDFCKNWNLNLPNDMEKVSTREAIRVLSNKNTDLIKIVAVQKHCITFAEKRKTITYKIGEINTNSGKDYSDILKSFANFQKTYSFILSADTNDNNTRLNNFLDIQDSCLMFVDLRKTITQNNAKIAEYSKTAPTIVKAYNSFMKGVDLSWNTEPSRNNTLREIINIQNDLLKALSQPNIGEVDKSVKKLKDKSWENVKKSIIR